MRRAFFGRSVLGFGNSGKLCEVPSFAFNFSPPPQKSSFSFLVLLDFSFSFFLSFFLVVFNLGSQLFFVFLSFFRFGNFTLFFSPISFFFEIKKIDFMRR